MWQPEDNESRSDAVRSAERLLRRVLQGDVQVLDRAVRAWAALLDKTPTEHPSRVTRVVNYCCVLVRSFEVKGNEQLLDEAIRLLRAHTSSAGQPRHRDQAKLLGTLGWALLRKAEYSGDRTAADDAVAARRGACSGTDRRTDEYIQRLTDLGGALAFRAALTGSIADLREAATVHEKAVRRTGDQDPQRAVRWSGLGSVYVSLYERTADTAQLESGVECHRKALAAISAGEQVSIFHSNLGTALSLCYHRSADAALLDEAIACHHRAVDAAPPGHFDRPRCLLSLATALQTRFEAIAELPILNEAITTYRLALKTLDGLMDHPQYARTLCGLAGALILRFQHIGDSDSLHEALERLDEGVRSTPPGHANLPNRLSTQSVARYLAFQAQPHMYEQISEPVRTAISLVPSAHVHRGQYLSNLGAYLNDYYEHTGDPGALAEALGCHEEALETTPAHHTERGKRMANWASSLAHQARHTRDPADAERAVTACTAALDAMPAPNPHRAQSLQLLGELLILRSQLTGNTDDHATACGAWQEAADDTAAPTLMRIQAAHRLADAAAAAKDTTTALHAFAQAVSLIGQAAWHGLDQEAQSDVLHRLARLPQDAAALAIEAGNLPLAVELLEEGRGILLAHTLDDDMSYRHVHARAPQLAERLAEINAATARLPHPVSSLPEERDYAPPHHPSPMDMRTALAIERDRLVEEIRQTPGLDNLFHPPRYADLHDAGTHGPVVIINISSYRCDAIAITPHGTDLIPLPLTRDDVTTYATTLRTVLRTAQSTTRAPGPAHAAITQTLARIWETITGPVLDALGITQPAGPTGGPRLWWCPTGPAAALPLHAAGLPTQKDHHDTVLDRVTCSYTPTVRALQHQRSRPAPDTTAPPRPLIVAMPATHAWPDLPGARTEAEQLAHRCSDARVLSEHTATVGAVTAAMPEHTWIHFSCHGQRMPYTHDGGRLLLHDGPLTARQIARLRVPGAAFAYVSACATYSSAADDLDECLSIGSALQLAGYQNVIATLWPVYDSTTANLSRTVYDRLLAAQHDPDPRQAAAALRKAVLKARRTNPDDPTRWAPYLHLGPL